MKAMSNGHPNNGHPNNGHPNNGHPNNGQRHLIRGIATMREPLHPLPLRLFVDVANRLPFQKEHDR